MNTRIKLLRTALGLTLAQFGAKIGMSVGGLSDIERGRNAVQERTIKLILSSFPQVNESWLRDGEGDMFRSVTDDQWLEDILAEMHFPDIVNEYIRTYAKCPPDVQEALDKYMRLFVKDLLAKRGLALPDQEEGEDPAAEADQVAEMARQEYLEAKKRTDSEDAQSHHSTGTV